jgi:hypothetical protein
MRKLEFELSEEQIARKIIDLHNHLAIAKLFRKILGWFYGMDSINYPLENEKILRDFVYASSESNIKPFSLPV